MAGFERIVTDGDPVCPAASLVSEAAGGTGCVCRITTDLIDSRRNPSTLRSYCFSSGYQQCPTWQADRDEWLRSRRVRDLLNSHGDRTGGHPEDRERNEGLALALDAREREAWETERQRSS